MKIWNNTDLALNTEDEINKFIANHNSLKLVTNKWRQRNILLYGVDDKILSIGRTFDRKMIVIAMETKEDWTRELNSTLAHVVTE
jgi:hypothetical protein